MNNKRSTSTCVSKSKENNKKMTKTRNSELSKKSMSDHTWTDRLLRSNRRRTMKINLTKSKLISGDKTLRIIMSMIDKDNKL